MRSSGLVFHRRRARHQAGVRRSSITRMVALITPLLGMFLIVGCAKNPSKPKPTPSGPEINTDLPTGNAQILSQRTIGSSTGKSEIHLLESADGSSYFFKGMLDGSSTVGRLDASGGLLWHVRTAYEPGDIKALTSSSPLPGGAIVVGQFDSNGDGQSDKGYATLFTSSGSVASEVVYASDSSDVWLSAIAPLSDSVYVAVGGEHTPNRTNPLVALLAITAPGTLVKKQQAAISSIPGRAGYDVTPDPGDAILPSRRIYLATISLSGSNVITLHGIDINAATLTPMSVAWTQTLSGKGHDTWPGSIRVLDGSLYVAGYADDPDKTPPSGGGYWRSGLVARLSLAGTVAWQKVVAATSHQDFFLGVEPTPSAIVAVGGAASYRNTTSNDVFGYGWVARFAVADGATLSSLTFGDATNFSGFNGGHAVGAVLAVGGFSRQEVSGGPYEAWWSTLNLNPTVGQAAIQQPASARREEAPVLEHGRGFVTR